MFLITSGAYIDQEFVSEIGLLPPSFLPVGNRCLFEHQIALASQASEKVCLSVPESYQLNAYARNYLEECGVELIPVPEGLRLGESILYCLNMTESAEGTLRILHGDTLFANLSEALDEISLSPNTGYYSRAALNEAEGDDDLLIEKMAVDDDVVVSGYFSFSCVRTLIRNLTRCQGRFIQALNGYHREKPLAPLLKSDWYDFGHLNSYFASRADFTTERSFNALEISRHLVRKESSKIEKMRGEARWFSELPAPVQLYTPKLLEVFEEEGRAGYSLEYVYNLPLSDLFVFGRLAKETWRSIFRSCDDFMRLCRASLPRESPPDPASLNALYLPKTLARLDEFAVTSGFSVDEPIRFNGIACPSPRELARFSSKRIASVTQEEIAIVHGDFCFSNILYDFRTRRIKVVDPRGVDLQGAPTLFGDRRYDYAKLYHSVYGLYDLIVAGRLKAQRNGEGRELAMEDLRFDYHQGIRSAFEELFFRDQPQLLRAVRAINVQLFLSMLPLHADRPDRQFTMLANAYRLYLEMEGVAS